MTRRGACYPVKIESIGLNGNILYHVSSVETKKIKLDDPMPDLYRYLEEYMNASGFRIIQAVDTTRFVLYKD